MSDTFKVGTWVTYDDEDPKNPTIFGKVVEPTPEECAYGAEYEYPRGLDHGDVVVEWDDVLLSRCWEEIADLQMITPQIRTIWEDRS